MPMSKKDTIQETLDELAGARQDPTAPESLARLEAALGHESARVVARAADLAAELDARALVPHLAAAFARLMSLDAQHDPYCRAKVAIVAALRNLGHEDHDLFRRAARHVQLEPLGQGTVDTAGELRGEAMVALLRSNDREAWVMAAEMLGDPDPNARLGAASAIASLGNAELGIPLLRMRIRIGESDAEVMSAYLVSLLALDPAATMEFVISFLDHPTTWIREAAAVALGESQIPSAFTPLLAFCEFHREERSIGLVAMAMLGTQQALDFLLAEVMSAPLADIRIAVDAMFLYGRTSGVHERLLAALARRGSLECQAVVLEELARE